MERCDRSLWVLGAGSKPAGDQDPQAGAAAQGQGHDRGGDFAAGDRKRERPFMKRTCKADGHRSKAESGLADPARIKPLERVWTAPTPNSASASAPSGAG